MDHYYNATGAQGLAAPVPLPSVDPDRPPPLAAAGAAPPRIGRHPETAPPADKAGGDRENTTIQNRHFAARLAVEQADKAFGTLRALLALKGHVLSRTHGDDGPVRFYVTHWALVRELRDIAAVRAFAEQVGATHA